MLTVHYEPCTDLVLVRFQATKKLFVPNAFSCAAGITLAQGNANLMKMWVRLAVSAPIMTTKTRPDDRTLACEHHLLMHYPKSLLCQYSIERRGPRTRFLFSEFHQ